MKTLRTIIGMALLFFMVQAVAQSNDNLEQTVEKGKSDLVEALKQTGEQFDFGIDPEAVKNARAARPLAFHEVNFDQLLEYKQNGIASVLQPEHKKIVPLMLNNTVVTTISISNKEGKYQVTDLINHQYENDLNQLPAELRENNFENLKVVYVPNLNTTVYSINGKSYTDYGDRTLRQGMDSEVLMQELKVDAKKFQQAYGTPAKQGKLLN
ncbi:hypothetical protein B4Q04_09350 [Zobellia sp. OII3]|uniref:hypothetical protein n=1 Tax=Zobellia sp. OII3 TaxID=2034520 RepID=UPI000B536888|nr:hypothetical protein [Zobellia sp. OII3]OWW25790.1 hypothetical protein B4Q04_09350 [Zobellia sp. OII3]